MFRDRTEEWWHLQQGANARARFLLGMNETAPPSETESSLRFYGMGTARFAQRQLLWAPSSSHCAHALTAEPPPGTSPACHLLGMTERICSGRSLESSLMGCGMGVLGLQAH